jgi:hypothetical protein
MALSALERRRQRLEDGVGALQAQMLEGFLVELGGFGKVLVAREAQERKTVVRCFLKGIRIESETRQAVLEWYRLPRSSFLKNGGAEGARTPDPKTASLVLSQLSYSPTASSSLPSGRAFVKIGQYLRRAQPPAACLAARSAAS